MTISEICFITKPIERSIANDQKYIQELCIDSRQVQHPSETLFFAFKTEKNDGHRFIASLIQRGVRSFVILRKISELTEQLQQKGITKEEIASCDFISVADTTKALQTIAQHHREEYNCPVVGITGSNGKTIVKEWLASIVSEDFNVTCSPNSYNSQLGVPLSVWQMVEQTEIAIFEAGISQPGEMNNLANIIHPTLGILTNVGMAHAQFFKSQQQKIREKLRLFQNTQALIYHNDNEEINKILAEPEYNHLRKISWGDPRATYPVVYRHIDHNHTLLTIQNQEFCIPFLDAASIENAIHVIVAALELGIASDNIRQRLLRLTRINMRTEILEGINHSLIINDTYSLDINSLRAALDFWDTQNQLTSKTIILSDFDQVGELGTDDYKQLNTLLKKHHVNTLITIGSDFQQHRNCFDIDNVLTYTDTESLLQRLPELDFSYQSILIKGARIYHFEKIVNQLQHKTHLTILNVSLPAIAHNLNYHRSLLKPETKMVAMVKAHSYGLGDAELVNELIHQNIDYLAVAYTDEGVRLRKRHIQTPIIVLGAEAHSFDVMVQHNLEPEIFNFYYLYELEKVLKRYPQITHFNIHIKLDTGMHRLGFDEQDLSKLINIVKANPQLRIASIFSHLAASEDANEDAYTLHQIELFKRMTETICQAFDYPILRHILNSAGIVRFTEHQLDMVRLGISLYGFSSLPDVQANLQNVATLKTVITQVKTIAARETIGYNRSYRVSRNTQVAIIPIGYADGYPRELSNGKGTVIIQGQKVPVIGKICMDMCMLDVTGLTVHEGDEVIVYGEGNTAADMAKAAGLISYELLTRISQRVPRVYIKE